MWKIDKGHSSGTTTAAYVTALDWPCAELGNKTIHLFNTSATQTLSYKLLASYHEGQSAGKEDVLVAQTSLAIGGDARMQYDRHYQRLILQVIDNSGHATYEVNYSGQGA
jgi:hypothetical protein